MKFEEQVELLKEGMLEKKNFNKISLTWFFMEGIILLFFIYLATVQFWRYSSLDNSLKVLASCIFGIIIYDVIRCFIYVRYTLIKNS